MCASIHYVKNSKGWVNINTQYLYPTKVIILSTLEKKKFQTKDETASIVCRR